MLVTVEAYTRVMEDVRGIDISARNVYLSQRTRGCIVLSM